MPDGRGVPVSVKDRLSDRVGLVVDVAHLERLELQAVTLRDVEHRVLPQQRNRLPLSRLVAIIDLERLEENDAPAMLAFADCAAHPLRALEGDPTRITELGELEKELVD